MSLRIRKKIVKNVLFRLAVSTLALVLVGASVPQPVRGVDAQTPLKYLVLSDPLTAPRLAPAPKQLPTIPAKPLPVKRSLWVTVTAYSSTVDQTDSSPFITASGSHVHPGTVAWNGVPFGTKLRFPGNFGDKIFTVEDRLNARATAYHLDVWMPTREEAIQWGARLVHMEVLQ